MIWFYEVLPKLTHKRGHKFQWGNCCYCWLTHNCHEMQWFSFSSARAHWLHRECSFCFAVFCVDAFSGITHSQEYYAKLFTLTKYEINETRNGLNQIFEKRLMLFHFLCHRRLKNNSAKLCSWKAIEKRKRVKKNKVASIVSLVRAYADARVTQVAQRGGCGWIATPGASQSELATDSRNFELRSWIEWLQPFRAISVDKFVRIAQGETRWEITKCSVKC